MKSTSRQNSKTTPQTPNNRQRPEIRDNLDHREGLEQQTKGDDITHNKKETKVNHLKEKKK